jgi:hypothetical protein
MVRPSIHPSIHRLEIHAVPCLKWNKAKNWARPAQERYAAPHSEHHLLKTRKNQKIQAVAAGAYGEEGPDGTVLWSILGRDIETLQTSPDRGARRAALLQLQRVMLPDGDSACQSQAAARASFFCRRVQGPLLAVICGDPVEMCRELAAAVLLALCDDDRLFSSEEGDERGQGLLAAYLPLLRQRVAAAGTGEGEGSEEVRLLLLRGLNALLSRPGCWPVALRQPVRGGEGGGPFADLAAVLARCVLGVAGYLVEFVAWMEFNGLTPTHFLA